MRHWIEKPRQTGADENPNQTTIVPMTNQKVFSRKSLALAGRAAPPLTIPQSAPITLTTRSKQPHAVLAIEETVCHKPVTTCTTCDPINGFTSAPTARVSSTNIIVFPTIALSRRTAPKYGRNCSFRIVGY